MLRTVDGRGRPNALHQWLLALFLTLVAISEMPSIGPAGSGLYVRASPAANHYLFFLDPLRETRACLVTTVFYHIYFFLFYFFITVLLALILFTELV